MAIISATAVTVYAPKITASAATITASGLIPIVQERIQLITNNYFTSDDLSIQSVVLFNATDGTIILNSSTEHWEDYGFKANDDFFIYRSYRNEGVKTIASISSNILTVTSACSVIKEDFNNSEGPIIYFSVIQWPITVVQTAALMIWFDYDVRDKVSGNIKSRSLGPLSESFTSGDEDEYGYPKKIISKLDPFRLVRLS